MVSPARLSYEDGGMKNGIIGVVGLALMALAGVAKAQIVHLNVASNLAFGLDVKIPEGKLMHVLYIEAKTSSTQLKVDDVTVATFSSSTSSKRPQVGKDIYCNGRTVNFFGVFVTYQFVDPPNTEALKKPSTAVVIPSDDKGDVEIIMESSTDMVTWTEALPGTYGTDTAKRFFRLRAVRVTEGE